MLGLLAALLLQTFLVRGVFQPAQRVIICLALQLFLAGGLLLRPVAA